MVDTLLAIGGLMVPMKKPEIHISLLAKTLVWLANRLLSAANKFPQTMNLLAKGRETGLAQRIV